MSAVRYQPRYTVKDYLGWEGDWELWDGVAVSMAPSPFFRHNRVAGKLFKHIDDQLEGNDGCGDCEAVLEVDWVVNEGTVVRPDVSVVCGGNEPEDFIREAPALVAEILSPSTRRKDLTAKRELYAREGVRYYLIGDVEQNTVTVLRLEGGEYVEEDGGGIDLHDECVVRINADRVFA